MSGPKSTVLTFVVPEKRFGVVIRGIKCGSCGWMEVDTSGALTCKLFKERLRISHCAVSALRCTGCLEAERNWGVIADG